MQSVQVNDRARLHYVAGIPGRSGGCRRVLQCPEPTCHQLVACACLPTHNRAHTVAWHTDRDGEPCPGSYKSTYTGAHDNSHHQRRLVLAEGMA